MREKVFDDMQQDQTAISFLRERQLPWVPSISKSAGNRSASSVIC